MTLEDFALPRCLMNLVIVTDFAHISGGSGRVALQTARELAELAEVESVTIFASTGPIDESLLGNPKLQVHVTGVDPYLEMSGKAAIVAGLWNHKGASEIQAILRSKDPKNTIVHVHSFKDAHTGSVVKAASDMGFPMVYTAHDYSVVCPHVGLYYAAERRVCTLKPMSAACICSNCQGTNMVRKQFNVAKFAIQTHRAKIPACFDRIVTVSNLSRTLLQRSIDSKVEIVVIPPPIEIEQGDRVRAEDNEVFTFVGRLSPEKDPVQLAIAAKELSLPIRFVGDGVLKDEVEKANPNAEITGWQPASKVVDFLKQARAVMLPSLWHETFGMTVMEGVALGVPAIVSNVCAAAEIVDNLGAGVIHAPGQKDQLICAMQEFEDSEQVRQFSETGYSNYWKSAHTMQSHLESLVQLYSDVLRTHGNG